MENTSASVKACKMCCMEIPGAARRCPYCHHYQDRWLLLTHEPAVLGLMALVPFLMMVGFLGFQLHSNLSTGVSYQTAKGGLVITESRIVFGELKSDQTVAVLGKVKNTGAIPWNNVWFHIDFYDGAGELVDVGDRMDNIVVSGNETSNFKVSFRREFPMSNYSKMKIEVISARDARSKAPF